MRIWLEVTDTQVGPVEGSARLSAPAAAVCNDVEAALALAQDEIAAAVEAAVAALVLGEDSPAIRLPGIRGEVRIRFDDPGVGSAAAGVVELAFEDDGTGGQEASAPVMHLLSWGVYSDPHIGYTRVTFTGSTSLLGRIRFFIDAAPKIGYGTNQSSPDQLAPHTVWLDIFNPAHMAKWYNLRWNYQLPGEPFASDPIDIGDNLVYVPLYPDVPFEDSGEGEW